jgi:polar amino acid transport system substrate-binding protein
MLRYVKSSVLVLGVILLVCSLPLFGPLGAARAADQGILQKVLSTHVLTIGTISDNSPWSFVKPDGSLDGYDVAIGKLLAHDLGAKADFVQTPAAGRIPGLQTHRTDLVLGELNYTPERAQSVAYTVPYSAPASWVRVLVSSKYKTLESLNSPAATMGYSNGSLEETVFATLFPKAKKKAFPTEADVYQALLAKRIDASGSETLTIAQQMQQNPGVCCTVLKPKYYAGRVCIAVAYGDFDWWNYVNNWVLRFNEDGDNQRLWTQYMKSGSPL